MIGNLLKVVSIQGLQTRDRLSKALVQLAPWKVFISLDIVLLESILVKILQDHFISGKQQNFRWNFPPVRKLSVEYFILRWNLGFFYYFFIRIIVFAIIIVGLLLLIVLLDVL